jgi:hypothetical protein
MASDISNDTLTFYVRLLDEGTRTSRPAQASRVGTDSFKLLATPNYDPEDEHWEFPPGSVVRCEAREHEGERYLLAIGLTADTADRDL